MVVKKTYINRGPMMKQICLALVILYQYQVYGTVNHAQEGDACARADRTWYAVPDSRNHFLFCHSKHGVYVRDECATRGHSQKEFNSALQQCIMPAIPAEAVVKNAEPVGLGGICKNDETCVENSICTSVSSIDDKHQCHCRQQYIAVHDRCWPIVHINHGNCTYNEQCAMHWPEAKCNRNICRCPDSTIPIETNDEITTCAKRDQCALGGSNVQLSNSANCHKKGGCSLNGVDLNYAFDCVKGPGFLTAICCPNKVQTCAQPPMPGNGPYRQIRYYYNAESDTCATFMYRGGLLVNSNAFESRSQCEMYCRSGCPKGQPKMENGKVIQCETIDDCGGQYQCSGATSRTNGTCCLRPDAICSVNGGVDTSIQRATEYDAGYPPDGASSVFYPVIRYYFSPAQRRCKAFLFQGIGGNSNQFLTMSHCEQYCAPAKCEQMSIVRDASTGEFVTCGINQPCANGGVCREGVCCSAAKKLACPPRTQMLYRSMDKSEPYLCNLTSSCPSPYSCHLPWAVFANQQRINDITGVCCLDPDRAMTQGPTTMKSTTRTTKLFPTTTSTTSTTTSAPTTTNTVEKTEMTTTPPTTTTGFMEPTTTNDDEDKLICPGLGRRPLTDNHGTPLKCHLGEESSCVTPEGDHMCTYKSVNETTGLCCERQQNDVYMCPENMNVLLHDNLITNELQSKYYPKSCSPMHLTSCGPRGQCIFDELYGSYHCCEKAQDKDIAKEHAGPDGCPAGQLSFMDPISETVLECSPSQQNTCPPGFGCYFSDKVERYQCCGVRSYCPANSAAMLAPPGDVITCNNTNGCPAAFYCHYNTTNTGTCCSEDPVIRLCNIGKALVDPDGHALRCDKANSGCPVGYSCLTRFKISVCCPQPNHLCYQPIEETKICPFRRQKTRFNYNKETRSCNAHITNGCSMSDNSFETDIQCQNFCTTEGICVHGSPLMDNDEMFTCSGDESCGVNHECIQTPRGNFCCPKKSYYCSLPSYRGIYCSGGQPRKMWQYNSKMTTCEIVSFRGCAGNLNLFDSEKLCRERCFAANCPHGHPLMTSAGGELYMCDKNKSPSCPVGYRCHTSDGNIDMKSVCCPTPDLFCRRTPEKGVSCGTPHLRYHYDSSLNMCKQFIHFGCGEIESSFRELHDCQDFCQFEASYCPAASKVYTWPNTSMPVTCSPVFDNCPKDYTCQQKSMSLYFCCSEPVKCLSGKKPFMKNEKSSPKSCFAGPFGYFDGCPSRHSCQMATNGDHYCCPEADKLDACPQDAFPFVHASTGRPMVCSPDFSNCPYGFDCAFNGMFDQNYCCSGRVATDTPTIQSTTQKPMLPTTTKYHVTTTTSTTQQPSVDEDSLCDDRTDPLIDRKTNAVRICNPFLQYTCPHDRDCQYNRKISRYQCCQKEQKVSVSETTESREACPAGMQPFMHPRTQQPIVCQPGLAGFCPYASMCQYSALYWQFICCSTANAHADIPVLQDAANKTNGTHMKKEDTLHGIAPGDSGCHRNEQCSKVFTEAFCHDWVCMCPRGLFIHKGTCVTTCPEESETRVTTEGWRCTEH